MARLTNDKRETIARVLLGDDVKYIGWGNPFNKVVREDTKLLDKFYYALNPKKDLAALEGVDKRYILTHSSYTVYVYTDRETPGIKCSVCFDFESGRPSKANCLQLYADDKGLGAKLVQIYEETANKKYSVRETYKEIMANLGAYTTTVKLLKAWPEIKETVDKVFASDLSHLPAVVSYDELNKKLGLPKEG